MNKSSKIMRSPVFTVAGVLSCLLIFVFLRGGIIDIPFGTTEGAIICGIGALVILIVVTAFSVGIGVLIYRRKKRPNI